MKQALLNINQACAALSCGRTYLYECLNCGELKAVRLGRRTLIPSDAIDEFIATRAPYKEGDDGR